MHTLLPSRTITEPVDEPSLRHLSVIDGMAILQKVNVNGLTYGQMGNKILQMILSISCHADRIDVVFDTYNDISIKSAERVKRSSGSIKFQRIKSDHPVLQWNNFLSVDENETEIIEFLVNELTGNRYVVSDKAVHFYVTSKCYC